MNGQITFTMIKPDAVSNGKSGLILDLIIKNEFSIKALKMVKLSKCDAEKFYAVHRERPFYGALVEFMSSGPVIAAILEKENAVEAYRQFIGATDPLKAEPGTLRALFATSIQFNAVHGSDSDENAAIESSFFFNQFEWM